MCWGALTSCADVTCIPEVRSVSSLRTSGFFWVWFRAEEKARLWGAGAERPRCSIWSIDLCIYKKEMFKNYQVDNESSMTNNCPSVFIFLKKNTKERKKKDWCPLLTTVAPSIGGDVASWLALCSTSRLLAAVEWQWWAAPTGLPTKPSEWKKERWNCFFKSLLKQFRY